jgi:hypothetical protein
MLFLRRFSMASSVNELKSAIEQLDVVLNNLCPDLLSNPGLQLQLKHPRTGLSMVVTRDYFPSGVWRTLMPKIPSYLPLSFGSKSQAILTATRESIKMLNQFLSEPPMLDESLIDRCYDLSDSL